METTKTVGVLNNLIPILEEDREGYLNASKRTNDESLRIELLSISHERSLLIIQLLDEIKRLGTLSDLASVPDTLNKVWSDFKRSLKRDDDNAIIETCISNEKFTIEKFKEVLKEENLGYAVMSLIISQLSAIETDILKLKHQNRGNPTSIAG